MANAEIFSKICLSLETSLGGRVGKSWSKTYKNHIKHIWIIFKIIFLKYWKILEKLSKYGIEEHVEARFHHVRTLSKQNEETWERIKIYINLCGFCRNTSLALLISSIFLRIFIQSNSEYFFLPYIVFIGAIGMFYRYLKFFRLYSYELYTTYPDLEINTESKKKKGK